RRAPATRTARDPGQVPRVVGGPVGRVLRGRAHRELVHVGLAEHDRTGRAEALDDGRVVRRDPAFEDLRAAGGGYAPGDHHVLDGDRYAGQRPQRLTVGAGFVHGAGGGERPVGVDVQERVY